MKATLLILEQQFRSQCHVHSERRKNEIPTNPTNPHRLPHFASDEFHPVKFAG
jgi:hypothetical protein